MYYRNTSYQSLTKVLKVTSNTRQTSSVGMTEPFYCLDLYYGEQGYHRSQRTRLSPVQPEFKSWHLALLREVFLWVFWFPPLLEDQIPMRPELCACATSKLLLFIYKIILLGTILLGQVKLIWDKNLQAKLLYSSL